MSEYNNYTMWLVLDSSYHPVAVGEFAEAFGYISNNAREQTCSASDRAVYSPLHAVPVKLIRQDLTLSGSPPASVRLPGGQAFAETMRREMDAAEKRQNAIEAHMDKHGYGGKPSCDPASIVGLGDFIPVATPATAEVPTVEPRPESDSGDYIF